MSPLPQVSLSPPRRLDVVPIRCVFCRGALSEPSNTFARIFSLRECPRCGASLRFDGVWIHHRPGDAMGEPADEFGRAVPHAAPSYRPYLCDSHGAAGCMCPRDQAALRA